MLTQGRGTVNAVLQSPEKGDKSKAHSQYGGVAQLGEHLPCKQGVMGSNPIISTIQV